MLPSPSKASHLLPSSSVLLNSSAHRSVQRGRGAGGAARIGTAWRRSSGGRCTAARTTRPVSAASGAAARRLPKPMRAHWLTELQVAQRASSAKRRAAQVGPPGLDMSLAPPDRSTGDKFWWDSEDRVRGLEAGCRCAGRSRDAWPAAQARAYRQASPQISQSAEHNSMGLQVGAAREKPAGRHRRKPMAPSSMAPSYSNAVLCRTRHSSLSTCRHDTCCSCQDLAATLHPAGSRGSRCTKQIVAAAASCCRCRFSQSAPLLGCRDVRSMSWYSEQCRRHTAPVAACEHV